MNDKRLLPNTTQIPNILLDEWMSALSPIEFKVIMTIARQTYGWHKESDQISYSQLEVKTGHAREALSTALKNLRLMGKVEVTDKQGNILKTKEECLGKQLFYRLIITSSKIEQVSPNQFENRNSKIEHTKETNTKASTNVDGATSLRESRCPLETSLKNNYPNGHKECGEYYQSAVERRGFKFINSGKQFNFIHRILRAGFSFDSMNKTVPKMDKKYGRGNWDFATMAAFLEKGGANEQDSGRGESNSRAYS